MTNSDHVGNVRACTHTNNDPAAQPPTSVNINNRPPLRLVPAAPDLPTHIPDDDPGHTASTHVQAVADALAEHPVTAGHPPTIAAAAGTIWLPRDEARHGRAGQLAAAVAGVAQVLILCLCWGVAHVLGASKTRAALSLIVLLAAVGIWAAADHL